MRKFWATMLAVIMILCAMLCASACGGTNAPAPSDPDTSTDPSGNENGDGNSNNKDEDNDPYAKYSQILQNVLKSSYYQNVVDHYKVFDSQYYETFQPHPYKLIEDLGINIDRIKNRETAAYSTAYIKGDDTSKLYVTTRVENKDSTPYYHSITACYKLTDDEYNDLEMLHRKGYIQAPLFIQELSYVKNPINYTYTKITIDSYNRLAKVFHDNTNLSLSVFGTQDVYLDFDFFDLNTNTFRATIRTSKKKEGLIGFGKIGTIIMYPDITTGTITTDETDSSIFKGPTFYWDTNLEDYKNSCEDITYFYWGFDSNLLTELIKQ